MGIIIKQLKILSAKERKAKLFFDTGASSTFIKSNIAEEIGNIVTLPRKYKFKGIDGNTVETDKVIFFAVNLLDIWCPFHAFVIEKEDLPVEVDVFIGCDFMEKYNIKLDPKKKDIIVDKEYLKQTFTILFSQIK